MTRTTLNLTSKSVILVLMAAFTSGAWASGTKWTDNNSTAVDHFYEKGKAVFYAVDDNGQRAQFCVKGQDGLQKVSRKTVKVFAGTDEDKLVQNLTLCDQPDKTIAALMPTNSLNALVYFLNKRYLLGLYDS